MTENSIVRSEVIIQSCSLRLSALDIKILIKSHWLELFHCSWSTKSDRSVPTEGHRGVYMLVLTPLSVEHASSDHFQKLCISKMHLLQYLEKEISGAFPLFFLDFLVLLTKGELQFWQKMHTDTVPVSGSVFSKKLSTWIMESYRLEGTSGDHWVQPPW